MSDEQVIQPVETQAPAIEPTPDVATPDVAPEATPAEQPAPTV